MHINRRSNTQGDVSSQTTFVLPSKRLSLQHLPQILRWLNHESKVTSAFNFVTLRDLEHKKANVRYGSAGPG
jgi:hypothetical protein